MLPLLVNVSRISVVNAPERELCASGQAVLSSRFLFLDVDRYTTEGVAPSDEPFKRSRVTGCLLQLALRDAISLRLKSFFPTTLKPKLCTLRKAPRPMNSTAS